LSQTVELEIHTPCGIRNWRPQTGH